MEVDSKDFYKNSTVEKSLEQELTIERKSLDILGWSPVSFYKRMTYFEAFGWQLESEKDKLMMAEIERQANEQLMKEASEEKEKIDNSSSESSKDKTTASNPINPQSLFKIQSSSSNQRQNEDGSNKDDHNRQALVIKIVRIAQEDDNQSKKDEISVKNTLNESDNNNMVSQDDNQTTSTNDDSNKNESDSGENVIAELKNVDILPRENNPTPSLDLATSSLDHHSNDEDPPASSQLLSDHFKDKSPINKDSIQETGDKKDEDEMLADDGANDNEDNTDLKDGFKDAEDSPSAMGRNRRVRQKNRYFSDFHCMNLAKGTRSRDDSDTNTLYTGSIRTTHRRSTTDSGRSSLKKPGLPSSSAAYEDESGFKYITKNCRKCRRRTAHDELTDSCQVCIYRMIAKKHKSEQQLQQAKAGTTASSNKRKSKPRNDKSTTSTPQSTSGVATPNVEPAKDEVPKSGSKRKAPKQINDRPNKLANTASDKVEILCFEQLGLSGKGDGLQNIGQPETHEPNSGAGSQQLVSSSPDYVYTPYPSPRSVSSCSSDTSSRKSLARDLETVHSPVSRLDSSPRSTLSKKPENLRGDEQLRSILSKAITKVQQKDQATRSVNNSSLNKKSKTTAKDEAPERQPDQRDATAGSNDDQFNLDKLDTWTPEQVADYVLSRGFTNEAELFKTELIDGISLLLMQRNDFTFGLKMKLGPALKLYDQVCRLKNQYFGEMTTAS